MREGELVVVRELVRCEPGQLGDVVGGLLDTAGDAGDPGETEDGAALVAGLHPDADELAWLDLEPGLLAQLADQRVARVLLLLDEAAGEIPEPCLGVERAAAEQEAAVPLDESLRSRGRVPPDGVAARGAVEVVAAVLALDAAARTEPPAVEERHRGYGIQVSPRHVPATVHELTRVGLLSGLPGEHLSKLAARLEREEIEPGATVIREGDPGDRFYVVLSGMFNVRQEGIGDRRVLRPGDAFGEVALAMGIPRTASVRAITPAVVASCDQSTFDELLRPLFADE